MSYQARLKRCFKTDIGKLFEIIRDAKGYIWVIGNGGSFSVAQHGALDLTKAGGKKAICLSDPGVITAYANDLTFEKVFKNYLKNFINPQDILIALSASGESNDILKAVEHCNKTGITTIGLTSKGSELARMSKFAVEFDEKDPKILEDIFQITFHRITKMLEKNQ